MDYEQDLRRWPHDPAEDLAFQLMRSFAAVDVMLRDVGEEGWSADLVAYELLRRLLGRLQHMAEDFSVMETRSAAALIAEATERIGLDADWLDNAPAFRR